MKKIKTIIASALIATAAWLLGSTVTPSLGNPFGLPVHGSCQTSSATSTVNFLTGGTGTTTLVCDAYSLDTNVKSGFAIDSATLAVQFTGSSTLTTLNATIEYSNDNIEWYQSNLGTLASTSPTTASSDIVLNGANRIVWAFASSTPLTGTTSLPSVDSKSNRTQKLITVPTPTRYVRAIFTLPLGSTNGSVWAEFIPKVQVK